MHELNEIEAELVNGGIAGGAIVRWVVKNASKIEAAVAGAVAGFAAIELVEEVATSGDD